MGCAKDHRGYSFDKEIKTGAGLFCAVWHEADWLLFFFAEVRNCSCKSVMAKAVLWNMGE